MTLLLNPLPFMKETESLISELLLSSENYFNETFFKIVILSFPLMKKRRSVTFISYAHIYLCGHSTNKDLNTDFYSTRILHV